jgi:hypothetical protein
MAYIGQTPSAVPLDGSDIADDIVDSQHYAAGSIDTAHLADDQITLAKMAAGTDGNIISYDASGNPVAIATGTDGQVLTSTGAGSAPAFEALPSAGITLGTVTATTSGTAIDFTGIPSGTKRITINFDDCETNGANGSIIQLGDSGGFETSGYKGAATRTGASTSNVLYTAGMSMQSSTGETSPFFGTMIMTLLDASTNTWASLSVLGREDAYVYHAGSSKSLSGELTQVRLTTVGGSDAYDTGKVNIAYE